MTPSRARLPVAPRTTRWVLTLATVVATSAVVLLPPVATAHAAPDLAGPPVRDLLLPARPWLAGHRGLDLPAAPGDPVHTPRAGIVRFAGRVAGVPVVVIGHGPLRATYQPVRTTRVVGDRIRRGEVLGTMAATGGHCEQRCLHWGLRVEGTSPPVYLDPRLLLGDVRLLP